MLIIQQLKAVFGETIEVLNTLVHHELRRMVVWSIQQLLCDVKMPVIDVRIGDNVHQCANFEITHLCEHVQQNCILNDVPIIGHDEVAASLI